MNTLIDLAIKKFSIFRTMSTIVLVIMCCMVTIDLCAQKISTSGGVCYSGSSAWRNKKSSSRKITIKAKFKGHKIEEVHGFEDSKNLEQVTIAEGITEIGFKAFQNCTNLKVVTLPKSLREIGPDAFSGCVSLESISLPEGVSLGLSSFRDCIGLTKVDFSPNIKFSEFVFWGCINLSEVILPDGVKLGRSSFQGCRNIKKLKLPSDIVEIPADCFHSSGILCSTVNIPESVKKIGDWAFFECGFLPSKLNLSPGMEIGHCAFGGTYITEAVIPDGYEKCDWFWKCKNLKKVTLPSTLKVIGSGAFRDCKSLELIEVPHGVEEIEENAFQGCSRLSNLTLPESLKSIGGNAFDGCKTVLIPDSVRRLQDIPNNFTFKNAPFFLITLEKNNIIRYTRQYDMGQKYDFPADDFYFAINEDGQTVTIIGDYFRCYNKPSVEIPARVEYNGKNYTVTGIDDGAFASCYNLKEITMPEGITSIGEMAFADCNELTLIDLPESVNYIGRSAFLRCRNLSNVHLPNQLTTINRGTFERSGVQNINLGNIEVIDSIAFRYCKNLETPDLSNLVFVGNEAFYSCRNIKILALPRIRTIESYAFFFCDSLQHIFLSDSLTVIPEHAFGACHKLVSANLENVLSFGKEAFGHCEEFYDYTLNPHAEYTESSFNDCGVNYRKRIEAAKKAEEEQQRATAEAQHQYEKSQRLDRVQAWLGFATAVLNAAGQSFSDIAQAQRGTASRRPVPEYAQPYTSTSGTTASTTSSRSSVETKRSNTAMDLQNRNTEQRAYDNYSSMLCSAYYGTGFYKNTPLSKIKDWQNTMRSIRLKWVNKGYSFYQSSWETKDFSGRK